MSDDATPPRAAPAIERLDVRLERGAIDLDDAIAVTRLLAEAMDGLHSKGEIDGALVPSRIELRGSGDVRLNVATPQDHARRARKAYTAPEAWSADRGGAKPVAASDQFAMAAILYEALCGGRAFPGDQDHAIREAITTGSRIPLAARVPGLAHAVDSVFERALDVSPDRRFASCKEFADALIEAIERSRAVDAQVLVRKPSARPSRGPNSGRLLLVEPGGRGGDDEALTSRASLFFLLVVAILAACLAYFTTR